MKRNKILIVDDVEVNREILIDILANDYDLLQGENGLDAIEIAMSQSDEIAVILLDIMMPEMNGFEALEILKANEETKDIAVLMITAANSSQNEILGLTIGASDFISKPFNHDVVKARISSQIKLRDFRLSMNRLVTEKIAQMEHMQEVIIDLLANIVECRDVDSGYHIKRTRHIVRHLVDKLMQTGKLDKSVTPTDVSFIISAVALHDIGKISIPDDILLKPGRLTADEFEIMKSHTWLGAEIAKQLTGLQNPKYIQHIQDICLYHHEKWDGTGYPMNLTRESIPYSARLMAISDVYDALVTKRVYKEAFSHEKTIEIIQEGSGTHFDPTLVEVFLQFNEEFKQLSEQYE